MDKGEGRGRQEMGQKAVDGKDQRCCLSAHDLPPNLDPGS